ncbi:MAG: multicopper oxidase domain-containing protein [Hyphomicrobiales bacterium]|nr:multicopper oxidase domain-containing protein [Hyphomicrobiales bacterium]
MYLSHKASRNRLREAERARENRREIVRALSIGQITKRDLFKWGIFTTTGFLAYKNGLSPYAPSAYGQGPTGVPRSPTFGAKKFTEPMPRAVVQKPVPLVRLANGNARWNGWSAELPSKKASYHNDYYNSQGAQHVNPVTGRGPFEGRPPGPFFEHQRWDEFFPKVGYALSIGQVAPGSRLAAGMPELNANTMWSFGARPKGAKGTVNGLRTGSAVPLLIKARYGEPMIARIYNDLPVDRAANGGFGRNEPATHFHNGHNAGESDGASNAFHFPGTFFDYLWSTSLARGDLPSAWLTTDPNYARKASGPDNGEGLVQVRGDFRELQGSMWFHDHRFFFTSENLYKGMFGLINFYSGPDRGREDLSDGINLQLPSGTQLKWGNTDFDVNLAITNPVLDQGGQLLYDIFNQDGFLGDLLLVNGKYYPYLQVLPRRYRLRILNGAVARFIKLALAVNRSPRFAQGTQVPFHFIANDGNFVVRPIPLTELDEQGIGERYDIVVDFAAFAPGDSVYLVNLLQQRDGRRPDGAVSMGQALQGVSDDPAVGPLLELRIVNSLRSVDNPGKVYNASNPMDRDRSADLNSADWVSGLRTLTAQIPVVAPVRQRLLEFGRSGEGDSRLANGQCIPECPDAAGFPAEQFPWSISVNGQKAHTLNANRISAMIPKGGDIEHWTIVNTSPSWDHPMHLHFEEGVTIDRGTADIPATERLVRKDVWRLRRGGRVTFQVRFGEFGGAYVAHCHNAAHEDFAMLMRVQILTPPPGDPYYRGSPQYQVTRTPLPSPDGVRWINPEILPEANTSYKPPGA